MGLSLGIGINMVAGGVPNFELVPGGDFTSLTGWGVSGTFGGATLSIVSGRLHAISTGASPARIGRVAPIVTIPGHRYRVRAEFQASAEAGANVAVSNSSDYGVTLVESQLASSTRTDTFEFVATAVSTYIFTKHNYSGIGQASCEVDNVSMIEMDPALYAGLTLLTSVPNDINDVYWGKQRGTVTTGRTDAVGGINAKGFFETAVVGSHNVANEGVVNFVAGTSYIMEAIVKPIGGRWLGPTVYNADFSFGYSRNIDPATGTLGSVTLDDGSGVITNEVLTAVSIGGGFSRVRLAFTAAVNVTGANFYWTTRDGDGGGSFLGDITKGMDFLSLGIYRVG